MTELERVRTFFQGDRYATECTGIVIDDARDGYAKCRLDICPQHCNALGNPMGGAIFTLADFAFAVAANFESPNTVSLASQISYLGTAKGKVLFAEAHREKNGRSTCFYRIDVTDELGTQIACVTTNGFVI